MEIYGVTREQIHTAAKNAHVRADWQGYTKRAQVIGKHELCPGHIVRLRTLQDGTRGTVRDGRWVKAWASHSGRLSRTTGCYLGKAGVCWHGHYKFILEVFKLNPDARVTSRRMIRVDSGLDFNVPPDVYSKWGKITYDGIGNFSKYAHETGAITYQSAGPWNGYRRLTLRDMCWCEQKSNDVYVALLDEAHSVLRPAKTG